VHACAPALHVAARTVKPVVKEARDATETSEAKGSCRLSKCTRRICMGAQASRRGDQGWCGRQRTKYHFLVKCTGRGAMVRSCQVHGQRVRVFLSSARAEGPSVLVKCTGRGSECSCQAHGQRVRVFLSSARAEGPSVLDKRTGRGS